jgi:putative ABC transport system permease protein
MRRFLNDLTYAFRQLRKTPGLALLAILTLALGIGANTAIFTVIESVLLRPLPYTHPDRLVYIGGGQKPGFSNTSWLNYRDVRDQARGLDAVAAYSDDIGVVQSRDESKSVMAPKATPNLFSMLGSQPLMGRTFHEAEGESGGPAVVLLSEGLWRKGFHSDPGIVGQAVRVGGIPYTVIGVMPASFRFPEQDAPGLDEAVWLPMQPTAEMLKSRGYHFLNVIGERRPGVSVTQLQQELDSIASHLATKKDESVVYLHTEPYQQVVTGQTGSVLYALFAALGLVLLIACANVSNLLIARCLGRQQEFAVRAALGASRMRLIAQLLSEGLVLSVLGSAAGILLAELAILAVRKLPEGTIPRGESIGIHWTVVLVLAVVAVVTTLLSSLLPALLVARANPQEALQAASRGIGARSVSGKLSGWLVAGEVALSTLLLVGSGLLFHTLWNLQQSRLGFDTTRVTTFAAMPEDSGGFSSMAVSEDTGNPGPSVATVTYQPVLERIRQVPGVRSAALMSSPPFSGLSVGTGFEIVGKAADTTNKPEGRISAVSGDYARAMGTPVLRGRMIDDNDVASAPLVVVINETLAKKYFRNSDPLQKQINLGGKDTGMIRPYTIVGVLTDQVDQSIGSEVQPLVLVPQQQVPTTSLFYQALLKTVVGFVVKTRGDIPVEKQMRSIFHQMAPGLALDQFRTMQDQVDHSTFNQRLGLYLVASFAGLAVAMVIAGLYGVLTQLVGYRRREIGVRMALGATRLSVAQMILRRGSILIGTGLGVGLVLALALTRLIKRFLYEVQALDGWTYVGVALTLLVIGLIAAFIPARRAATIEPMEALRTE